ncbi:hypothetical protein [Chitinibacter sp. S2-10]|uniref:hypothetical protein n=1 Tax=Chitinibacter sp. S2-10 TaxID=3373597 RepID=UPI003977537B
MPLSQEERDAIIDAAAHKTAKEFAGEIATRTLLTTAEILALAETQEERVKLAAVLNEVTHATTSNESKAKAIRNIEGGVEALIKIASVLI